MGFFGQPAMFGMAEDMPLAEALAMYRFTPQGLVPYAPPSVDEAKKAAWGMTGIPDLQEAYKSAQRGEYLNALGRGVFGALGLASMAAPAAKGAMSAAKLAGPVLADTSGALKLGGPIRAYHGSPHDFDRFDMSKIGTGEGVQAYGHGLYFAEAEPVAWNYRYINAPVGQNTGAASFARQAASVAEARGLTGDEARRFALELLNKKAVDQDPVQRQTWFDAMNNYDALIGNTQPPGRMYEVNIHADPEAFLQWDKPLSQQSEVAGNAIKEWNYWRSTAERIPKEVLPGMEPTGAHVYSHISQIGGRPTGDMWRGNPAGQQFATGELRDVGIPGIRYLDQGSRGAGEGTHNYVLFDDSLIEILRKYGIAGLIAPGALAAPDGAQTR